MTDTSHRPGLTVLRYVAPHNINARHFEGVKKIVAHSVDVISLVDAALALREGLVMLWEVDGTPDPAIVCTRIIDPGDGRGRRLWLDGLAGNGIIHNASAIVADLRTIAREYNCTGPIGTATRREAWDAMSGKFGFTQVSATYEMEIDDVRRIEHTDDANADAEG